MNKVTYTTKEECRKAIETLKVIGIEPQPWMIEQLHAFEAAEAAKAVVKNSKTPIWDTLKAIYKFGKMPEEKIRCVENTVDMLLEEGPHAEEPGLLLGKIQCGKTDTFEDIIGLSFDKGVDIAIVITKGTKALVNQTVKRMKRDYELFKASDSLDQHTTINVYDIMDVWKNLKQAKVEGCKTVIVSKKNATNLDHLIEMFETRSPFLKKKKVLIVDDEADFASRNYRSVKIKAETDEDGNPVEQTREISMAKIAQQIDDFRKIPEFCRYLQVTATPYCLYLQPQGELNLNGNMVKPFKPRFTSLVPVHDKYIGGQQYFVESQDPESMYSHLFHQIDQKCIDVMGHEDKRYLNAAVSSGNIYGLTYALVSYFMATAVRRIQVARTENKDYKTSAIIHVEIDKKNHDWQCRVVNKLIDSIKAVIVDEDQSDQRIWTAIDQIYEDLKESNRKGRASGMIKVELPSKEDVLEEIRDIFNPTKNNYHVQMVNSDEQMDSLLDEDTGELMLDTAATIFIGGNILDRGVTIMNMLCFFYGRDPKNFQQDTVLQHARMYGSRPKEDMAVMRLHTTARIYKILVRMNELDEQLRQWFIEGKDQEEPNAVFVGFDKNIKPCATQKIKASNALILTSQKRIVPSGFWTGTKKEISKTVEKIDSIIESCPGYANKDAKGFFEMDKDTAFEILNLIKSTYVYDSNHYNVDRKGEIDEMMCALEYCTSQSDNKLWVLHRTNRNLSRVRENGAYVDAPDDGRTDTKPSREKAVDEPVLMLIRQNGEKMIDENGNNIGWNNTPFYWPVVMAQQNITTVMFALEQATKKKAVANDLTEIMQGLNPDEVLDLTFKEDDPLDYFGEPGTEFSVEDECFETRVVKETTASRYILKDENGNWKINTNVVDNPGDITSIYSMNGGVFPFVVKPYKYMILRHGRNSSASVMLLELHDPSTWSFEFDYGLNENGDLTDNKGKVYIHASDIITDKNLDAEEIVNYDVCLWIIKFRIKKILKYKAKAIIEGNQE